MDVPQILLGGVVFGESPRWHGGRLWFSDWETGDRTACAPARCRSVRKPCQAPTDSPVPGPGR
jgi:hypothetical protein